MARGGARQGAGRKAGSATEKTREVADRASQNGAVPLEVMLDAMRYFHTAALNELMAGAEHRAKVVSDAFGAAAAIAKDAAPFMHPKLATVEHKNGEDGPFQIIIASGDAEL